MKSNYQKLKTRRRCNNQGDLEEEIEQQSKLMFPNIESFVKPKDNLNDTSSNVIFHKPSNMSLWSLSKKYNYSLEYINNNNFYLFFFSISIIRPIICPYKNCRKAIAVASMEHHFAHEHKRVPLIKTQLDARNGLDLYLDDVHYSERLCLVLINVIDKDGLPKEIK